MTTEEMLEQYADLLERQEMLQQQMQELIDKVPVPKEITDQWNTIKAEYQPMIEIVVINADAIKQQIQEDVLINKATVHGNKYMAVYVSGKKSWDGKKLEGFAMAYPEILQAQKVGEPTVTFRKVK